MTTHDSEITMLRRQADFNTAKRILGSFGISIMGEMTTSRDAAVSVAGALGYPVVMKLISPDIIHKTDAGVVLLDIDGDETARNSYEEILENAGKAGARVIDGILVQKQVKPGFEVLVGARQDPLFGALTMAGYGGRFVELFRDVAPGIGVLTPQDVERMLSKTKAGQIISGFRGPRLDREALIDLVIRVSEMMEQHPEITELDLNPVILYPAGFAIVDARMILDQPVTHPRAVDLSHERLKSLEAIFDARSVAVVGASRPGTVGGIILKNSSRIKKLYPINPKRESLLGRKCYPSLAHLPEPAEVAVLAVSPEATIRTFREFCMAGGKGAIIVSDGFAEIGRKDLEDQLVEISQKYGVVYTGPNGLGVIDNFSGLNTLFLPMHRSGLVKRPGPIGVISQSGGVGLELLEMLAADNLSVGKWVSCGNASGITIPELLTHMGDDPRIKIIAIYLEGLRNGLQFMEIAKKVAKSKPIILIKGGMAGGAAATMSHTASLAGSFEAFRAACQQAGLYLIEELTEDPKLLINILSMLTTQKRAMGNRVGVVSVGGGAAILLADQLTTQGMRLAEFSPETKIRLAQLLVSKTQSTLQAGGEPAAQRVVSNPFDLFGDADDDRLLESLRLLNQDEETDIIVVGLYLQVPHLSEYIAERLVELRDEMTKPWILSPRGFSEYVAHTRRYLTENGVPTYTVPMVKSLAVALEIWKRYAIDFCSP